MKNTPRVPNHGKQKQEDKASLLGAKKGNGRRNDKTGLLGAKSWKTEKLKDKAELLGAKAQHEKQDDKRAWKTKNKKTKHTP